MTKGVQLTNEALDLAFARLEQIASKGERCPVTSGPDADGSLASGQVSALAKAGKIFVEISSKNWRRVTILTGPYTGKSTAPNPHKGTRVYHTVGVEGSRVNGKLTDHGASSRRQPSTPRFLTASELK
jgi:predicted carbohydrate-binding protein with CBM5 and CBM33 domain